MKFIDAHTHSHTLDVYDLVTEYEHILCRGGQYIDYLVISQYKDGTD